MADLTAGNRILVFQGINGETIYRRLEDLVGIEIGNSTRGSLHFFPPLLGQGGGEITFIVSAEQALSVSELWVKAREHGIV